MSIFLFHNPEKQWGFGILPKIIFFTGSWKGLPRQAFWRMIPFSMEQKEEKAALPLLEKMPKGNF